MTALLNAKLRLVGYHIVSVGSLNEAIAHPREIYRATILAGASAASSLCITTPRATRPRATPTAA